MEFQCPNCGNTFYVKNPKTFVKCYSCGTTFNTSVSDDGGNIGKDIGTAFGAACVGAFIGLFSSTAGGIIIIAGCLPLVFRVFNTTKKQ